MGKFPPPLRPGGTVAIVAPATTVKAEYVAGAVAFFEGRGYRVRVMPHALGPACGTYASSLEHRLQDLQDALLDPAVQLIFCARGGYGCVHLLDKIPVAQVVDNPKWLVGFSDISALHALWQNVGLVSLHAPMAKHITLLGADDCTEHLMSIITAGRPHVEYILPTDPHSRLGNATGTLVGGNLAVLSHLIGTPFDTLTTTPQPIIFLEDIGEAIYASERMLWQLCLAGALHRAKGIIIGQFTDSRPDKNFPSPAAMIAARLREWGVSCPIAADFPAGHVDYNLPLPLGARVTLSIDPVHTAVSAS